MGKLAWSTALCFAGVVASIMGCGARTGLGTGVSGSAPADAGPPPPPLPCAGASTIGTIAWQADLGGGGQTFTGPLATDARGVTFFVGSQKVPITYTVVAIDSCGRELWRTSGTPVGAFSQTQQTVLVSGDQVIVQWGSVDAFDRATGAHVWNVDLNTLAGENLGLDDFGEIGPSAAADDGTVFVVFETGKMATIAAISPTGSPSTVATTPNQGDLVSLILDGAGQLDLLFNSAIKGALVESFARSGAPVFAVPFACNEGFLGALASSNSFLLMQTGPCVLTLQGAPGFSPVPAPPAEADYAGIVIDGQNNLYASGDNDTLFSFDATGHPRWVTMLTEPVIGGPLLATGGQILVLVGDEAANAPPGTALVALDAATGSVLRSNPIAVAGNANSPVALVTAAEHVVFVSGNIATAVAVGQTPAADAEWPTTGGGPDQRRAALGH